MAEIPDRSNFFASLAPGLSPARIANLYRNAGWVVRKCEWTAYELRCDWADLVLQGDAAPMLLHGAVADFPARADELLAPLKAAGVEVTVDPPAARR
jgi:hypothetical protein